MYTGADHTTTPESTALLSECIYTMSWSVVAIMFSVVLWDVTPRAKMRGSIARVKTFPGLLHYSSLLALFIVLNTCVSAGALCTTDGHHLINGTCGSCSPPLPANSTFQGYTDRCLWSCNANFYKSGEGCDACPAPHLSSPPGSSRATNCTCNAGYTGPDGGFCAACQAGKYKVEAGSAGCLHCAPGSYKTEAGEGTCVPCNAGTYNAGTATQPDCRSCLANSASPVGSSQSVNCTCNAGYTGPDGGPCSACEAGKYKADIGSEPCAQCSPGTYKQAVGAGGCDACPHGLYNNGTAVSPSCIEVACPIDSSLQPFAQNFFEVQCRSTITSAPWCETTVALEELGSELFVTIEVEMTDFGLTSEVITALTVGGQPISFDSLAVGGTESCGKYVTVVDSLALSSVPDLVLTKDMDLAVRIETSAAVNCCPCGGYYLNARVLFATAIAVAMDATNCTCNAGYTGPDGGPCSACEAGTFKKSIGSEPCAQCSPGTYKQAVGTGGCDACPHGLYNNGTAVSPSCVDLVCPIDSSLPPASQAFFEVQCRSTITSAPWCETTVALEELGSELFVTIEVEMTDFGLTSEVITALTVGGQPISFDSLAVGGTESCGKYVTVVDSLALSSVPDLVLTKDMDLAVRIETSAAVNCCPCGGLYLNARVLFATTIAVAMDATNCTCNAGYTGPDGGPCSACEAGTFKTSIGSEPCMSVRTPLGNQQLRDVVSACLAADVTGRNGAACAVMEQVNTSAVTDMSYLFSDAQHFNGNISAWDVSSVRDMSRMFLNAQDFTADISCWVTSSVMKMQSMFFGAASFNADLSKWNTAVVNNMNSMFRGAIMMNIDLSKWDVSSVTDMMSQFYNAASLNADLSKWDVSSVTSTGFMFAYNRDASSGRDMWFDKGNLSNWDVGKVTYMAFMFYGRAGFNGDLSKWNTARVATMHYMFFRCSSFQSDLSKWQTAQVNEMTVMFRGASVFNSDLSKWNTERVSDMSFMFHSAALFNSDLPWETARVTSMRYMFTDAAAFNGNISSWDVSAVTQMNFMFYRAASFTGEISEWDVSSVTDMTSQFHYAASLNADLSKWDVSSVTSMGFMFAYNRDASSGRDMWFDKGNLSNWDVGKVTYMAFMFYGRAGFNGDLSKWNTARVTKMDHMFFEAASFQSDLSKWDVSSVKDMTSQFCNASSFNGDLSKWDIGLVTSMRTMFRGASTFQSDLSKWQTGRVRDMQALFDRASKFNSALSNWDVSVVITMNGMFSQSNFDGDVAAWDVSKVSDMVSMFSHSPFNSDLSRWDVSAVRNMTGMFQNSSFNQHVGSWNTGGVLGMAEMFAQSPFNNNISLWDTGSVTTMKRMFYNASAFNGDITAFAVFELTDISEIFSNSLLSFSPPCPTLPDSTCTEYFCSLQLKCKVDNCKAKAVPFSGADCSTIVSWDTSRVGQMSALFQDASNFDGDLSLWNTDAVLSMASMFSGASSFNGDLAKWRTGKVRYMQNMFSRATLFDSDISGWNTARVTDMSGMFRACSEDGSDCCWETPCGTDSFTVCTRCVQSVFSADLSRWNVSSVQRMSQMFYFASSFTADLCKWDLGAVENLMQAVLGSGKARFCDCIAPPGSFCQQGLTDEEGTTSRCPAGQYCNGGNSRPQPCAAPPGSYCPRGALSSSGSLCPPGSYCTGQQAASISCAPGTFQDLSGGWDPECKPCPVGTFSWQSQATSENVCTKCFAGSFANTTASVQCVLCEAGTYQDKPGKAGCKPCTHVTTPGQYCPSGASAALSCPAGRRSNASVAAMKSTDDCITCSAGTFCPTGSDEETLCPSGTFNNEAEASECRPCDAGSYQDEEGQRACKQCEPARYCIQGSSAATPCPKGTRANLSLVMTSVDKCIVCPTGAFCPAASAEATECAPGTFNNEAGASICAPCRAGTFQDGLGATSCKPCQPGKYCPGGASAGLVCPAGSYSDATNLTSHSECNVCPIGHACPAGSKETSPCPAGSRARSTALAACELCPAGSYQDSVGQGECKKCGLGSLCPIGASLELPAACEPGKFANVTDGDGSPNCFECPAGSRCPGGAARPSACSPGSFAAGRGASECSPCKAGSYQPGQNATSCQACESGSYCTNGASAPRLCPAGRRTNPNLPVMTSPEDCVLCEAGSFCSTGSDTSTLCAPGSFGAQAGLERCELCAPGSFAAVGATACSNCGVGKYADNVGQGFCIPCPFSLSSSSGSTICSLCMEGYYLRFSDADPKDIFQNPDEYCATCPPAVQCAPGLTLAELPIPAQMWRASQTSSRIYECFSSESGYSPCRGSGSRRMRRDEEADDSGTYCDAGHRGPLCQVCVEAAHYYDSTTGRCKACSRDSKLATFFGISAGIAAFLALSYAVVRNVGFLERLVGRVTTIVSNLNLQTKLKTLIGFCQVFNALDSIYGVRIHQRFTTWMNVLRIMNFDVLDLVLPGECVGSMRARLLANALWPLAVILAVILSVAFHSVIFLRECGPGNKTKVAVSAVLYRSLNASIAILFIVMPTAARSIFAARQCVSFSADDFTGKSISFLNADLTVSCNEDDPEYGGLNVYFWTFFAFWVVMVPLVCMALALRVQTSVRAMHITKLANACHFLWRDYKPRYLYWELVDMLRKLLLTALIVFVDTEFGDSRLMRLLLATIVTAGYITVLALARPYKRFEDMTLVFVSNLLLACCFISGISIKLCSEGPWNDTCKAFFGLGGSYQVHVFVIILTVVMLALVLLIITIKTFTAVSTPTIRLASSGLEPFLELPDGCNFHCYLSHAWRTGQDQAHTMARQLRLMMPNVKVWLDVDNVDLVSRPDDAVGKAAVFVIFFSEGYFSSASCRREFEVALAANKPILTVREYDRGKGGATVQQLKAECREKCLNPEDVIDSLFAEEPIVWLRMRDYQLASLKLIALRMLRNLPHYQSNANELAMGLKVAGDSASLVNKEPVRIVVCAANTGSQSVAMEVKKKTDGTDKGAKSVSVHDADSVLNEADGLQQRQTVRFGRANLKTKTVLLLYLNKDTFLDSEGKVAAVVKQSLDLGFQVALVHEQDPQKGGCAFEVCYDQTPKDLLGWPYKLFDTFAEPLYEMPEHRQVSLWRIFRSMTRRAYHLHPTSEIGFLSLGLRSSLQRSSPDTSNTPGSFRSGEQEPANVVAEHFKIGQAEIAQAEPQRSGNLTTLRLASSDTQPVDLFLRSQTAELEVECAGLNAGQALAASPRVSMPSSDAGAGLALASPVRATAHELVQQNREPRAQSPEIPRATAHPTPAQLEQIHFEAPTSEIGFLSSGLRSSLQRSSPDTSNTSGSFRSGEQEPANVVAEHFKIGQAEIAQAEPQRSGNLTTLRRASSDTQPVDLFLRSQTAELEVECAGLNAGQALAASPRVSMPSSDAGAGLALASPVRATAHELVQQNREPRAQSPEIPRATAHPTPAQLEQIHFEA